MVVLQWRSLGLCSSQMSLSVTRILSVNCFRMCSVSEDCLCMLSCLRYSFQSVIIIMWIWCWKSYFSKSSNEHADINFRRFWIFVMKITFQYFRSGLPVLNSWPVPNICRISWGLTFPSNLQFPVIPQVHSDTVVHIYLKMRTRKRSILKVSRTSIH